MATHTVIRDRHFTSCINLQQWE